MKRLAIYFFFDKDGIVRDFVTYYVAALHDVAEYVCVVVNGDLTDASYDKLCAISEQVIKRENIGFDVWAYKDAMEQIGWSKVSDYDELILCNFTCYGPLFPFSEMFSEMSTRSCDFWGAVKHPEQPNYLLPQKKGYIYEHIMSYFIVVRKNMLSSQDFFDYWNAIPKINSKTESTAFHETVFTRHFEQLGYISDAYVNLQKYVGRCDNSSIFLADELLIKDRCPLLKRRAFAFPLYINLLNSSAAGNASNLMYYIKNYTNYDCNMIWQDLLQTQKMSLLRNNMHLSHVFAKSNFISDDILKSSSILFLFYLPKKFYLELLDKYFSNISTIGKIVLLCSEDEIFEAAKTYSDLYSMEILKIEVDSYGSTISALKACSDIISHYSYCCCFLSSPNIPGRLQQSEEDFCKTLFESLFSSREYISHILTTFNYEDCLGALSPYKSEFSSYYAQPFQYFNNRKSLYYSIYNQLKINVPFDDEALYDFSFAYWIRGSLLKNLCNLLLNESTSYILSQEQAINYLVPIIFQEYGYYTASVTTEQIAVRMLDNHTFMQRQLIAKMKQYGCSGHRFYEILQFTAQLRNKVNRTDIKQLLSTKIALRHLILLILRYPFNKLDNIKQRIASNRNASIKVDTSIVNICKEGERIVFYFTTQHNRPQEMYICIDGRKYFNKKILSSGREMVTRYIHEYNYGEALFFEIPIAELTNQKVELFDATQNHVNVRWSANFSFNALELRDQGLYVRVSGGNIFFQTKKKFCFSVLSSLKYSIRDKFYFLFALINPYHPFSLFSENGGAADNSFELFKYAIKQGERAYYVSSQAVKNSEPNLDLKKRMVIYNSFKHTWITLFSKRWIGSFSLRVELLPTNRLHDIHYALLPDEWDFIPHGMAIGDKEVAMLHRYSWDNPTRTFTSTPAECAAYADIYGFKNVTALGSPRMDKWVWTKVHDNEVMIFFTWRLSLSKRIGYHEPEKFTCTDYYKTIVDVTKQIRLKYPNYIICYVFHHEIVKNGMDAILRKVLEPFCDKFIYFNTTEGVTEFNQHFQQAKYLVTDFSSAAFDFAYKKDGIPIYYLPEQFIAGHYTLQKKFFDCQLGIITKTIEDLLLALNTKQPSNEMTRRKKSFFPYLDKQNCKRVYEAIFQQSNSSPDKLSLEKKDSSNEKISRLAIYFFYDAEGIVDNYVPYYLKELKKVCSELCVVVNGFINEEGEKKLIDNCDKLILRENRGFDSWAYKEAIESYGYDYISENFDELVLNNYTNFGPIYSFEEMFNFMGQQDCDFWGHNRYIDQGNVIEGTRIIDHLQSYFSVFRKPIISSPVFRKYWCTLSLPTTYKQAISYHELRYTRYFESYGFISAAFIPWKKYREGRNSPVYYAYQQMCEDRSPLLKRKVFFTIENKFQFPQKDWFSPYDIAKYISSSTKYDMNYIWENMKRTMKFPESSSYKSGVLWKILAYFCINKNKKTELYERSNRFFCAEKLYGKPVSPNILNEKQMEKNN